MAIFLLYSVNGCQTGHAPWHPFPRRSAAEKSGRVTCHRHQTDEADQTHVACRLGQMFRLMGWFRCCGCGGVDFTNSATSFFSSITGAVVGCGVVLARRVPVLVLVPAWIGLRALVEVLLPRRSQ